MLIANHDRMAPSYGSGDHRMALEEVRNVQGKCLMSGFAVLPQPAGYVEGQTEAGVIRGRDVTNDAVDSANVDWLIDLLCSGREY